MRRKFSLGLLILIAGSKWASAATVTDVFNGTGNSDVIGNKLQFDVQSIQVTTGANSMNIDIRMNFDNAALHSVSAPGVAWLAIGDLFFTVDGNYAYGVPLAYHNGPAGGLWGGRLEAGHIYSIDSPTALLTASQALHDPMYVDYRPDAVVWMVDLGGVHDVTVGTPSVRVLPIDGNDGGNGPLYDIRIVTSVPAGLFASQSSTYGVEFASSTAGSDVVQGALHFNSGLQARFGAAAAVPEPSTWYMVIGALLIGFARMSRRRGNR